MTNENAEALETPQQGAAQEPEEPTPPKKARVGKQKRHVAPAKAKATKKARPAKKAPKGAKAAKQHKTAAGGARQGSKTAMVLDLLKRPGGGHSEGDHESYLASHLTTVSIFFSREHPTWWIV